ncbi:AIM24 family protein [Streptomyces sp. CB01881]|uniref:AIM24 family protein n=1 Tax=Streptomyces sp. CB01881 TaxID=2078691 RepID=UPI000CDC245B|nr:AIM24 family protein [Streptomyces sp. CB01881]AUY47698.1 AIM24 family protein [Streptomyces sp. CB01881]TYC76172.1 AIM24 family protein [Streptomyces sp. CB01881]
MQSPLLDHTALVGDERFALQNPQLLRVALDGRAEVLARTGAMVAHTGRVRFTAWRPPRSQRNQQAGHGGWQGGPGAAQPAALDLMRCTGTGTVYLANLAQHLHILELQRDRLTITSNYVLALDAGIAWQAVGIEGGERISGVGSRSLELSGRGTVVVMTSGRPLVMPVRAGEYVYADADAVVGWSSALEVQLQAQSANTEAWRRRGTATEGWELSFTGDGFVIVQPSELLPPQRVPLR